MIEVEGALLRLQEEFQKVSTTTTPTEMYLSRLESGPRPSWDVITRPGHCSRNEL